MAFWPPSWSTAAMKTRPSSSTSICAPVSSVILRIIEPPLPMMSRILSGLIRMVVIRGANELISVRGRGSTASILSSTKSRASRACSSAWARISWVRPLILMSICRAVIPSRVPATLKSMSPSASSTPWMSVSTANLPSRVTRPIAMPATGDLIGTPASIRASVDPQTDAIDVDPFELKISYTIRLVSEILSSNGSTSMASVCGSTLALMDAGVPIKSPVAGIAMGLVTREGKFAVLTDIQGVEDALGDMDFKVAGTRDGITALQMDIKIKGLTHEIMAQALEQAREARLFVLDNMLAVLPRPRTEMSNYAPRITTILINPDKIRDIIGKGGSMIRKITEETGAQIDVEDDGRVFIAAVDQEAGRKAIDWIKSLTDEVEVGKIYAGKVVRIMPFGAFVEVLPNQDGLVHISKLTDHRVERVEEVCNIGDEIAVKAVEIDSQGRLNLSRQAAIEELTAKGLPIEEKISQEAMAVALASPPPAPREGGFGGRDRGGRNGGGRGRGPRRD